MIRKSELVTGNGLMVFMKIVELSAIRGIDLHSLSMRYALERFLARVFAPETGDKVALDGASRIEVDRESITLKGGLTMYIAEGVQPIDGRSTSDADFHVAPRSEGGQSEQFVEFLRSTLGHYPGGFDDGIVFDLDSLEVAKVKEGGQPGGKVVVVAQIGKFAVKVRSDIAFDSRPINKLASTASYPHILANEGAPPINIRHTPWEYAVADKFQAMVRHGAGNFRLRDYYDLFVIFQAKNLDPQRLVDAVSATFDLYGSEMPDSVHDMPALSDDFVIAKTPRWDSERETKQFGNRVPSLAEVVQYLRESLEPVLADMKPSPRPF